MRITIFGDSFGDDELDGLLTTEVSWVDILRRHGHEVVNFCQGGTSLYNAYSKYLNFTEKPQYENCDLIIFVMTGPGREEVFIDPTTYYITSIAQLEVIIDSSSNLEHRRVLEAFKVYWAYCKDFNKDDIFRNLMRNDIKQREKMFYIDTFNENDSNCITELSRQELTLMNPTVTDVESEREFMKQYFDRRRCHFSSVNNKMIGNKILQAINAKQNTVNFDINDIVKPEFDINTYFEKR
jgi:hypothetical protein